MDFLNDVITYVRRIVKTPSDAVLSTNLILDYINRFWINDVDARIQLFDLKTTYQFQTQPGVDQYNMPLYNFQTEGVGAQDIAFYPVYQGFMGPAYVNGVPVSFTTQRESFFAAWPKIVQQSVQVGVGDGSTGPYTLQFPISPGNSTPVNNPVQSLLRGHVDIRGIVSTGANIDPPLGTSLNTLIPTTSVKPAVYFTATDSTGANNIVCDSGQFLTGNVNYGLLMSPGKDPFGNTQLANGGALATPYTTAQNTINYLTGIATNVYFPSAVPDGVAINGQCLFYQAGLPRSVLFYNNTITLRTVPSSQFMVELNAYLSPCAFFSTSNIMPYAYMSEYIALGAARKMMMDTGDAEQLNFYEPFFKEQEMLVWKRSQRQFTSTRTETIFGGNANVGGNGGWYNGAGYF